jgi:protein-S-isoprenylcysteine O-methyltransferase Ste14
MTALELKIPPVFIGGICTVAMYALRAVLPGWGIDLPARLSIAALFLGAGALLALAGLAQFRRQRTTADPRYPDRAATLVTQGIYAFTRNPMYLGMLLMLVAWCVYLANAAAWLPLPLFVAAMNRLQIVPEERIMRDRFGEQYATYRARVRRWL